MDFKQCFEMNSLLCRDYIGEEKVKWDWDSSTQGQWEDGKSRSLSFLFHLPAIPCALPLFPLRYCLNNQYTVIVRTTQKGLTVAWEREIHSFPLPSIPRISSHSQFASSYPKELLRRSEVRGNDNQNKQ